VHLIRLLRTKMRARWLRILVLAFAAGVTLVPLSLLIERDLGLLPVFSALLLLTLLLVLWDDGKEPGPPGMRRPPTGTVVVPEVQHSVLKRQPSPRGPLMELAAFVVELTELNGEITRLCQRVAFPASAAAGRGARRRRIGDEVLPPLPLLLTPPQAWPPGRAWDDRVRPTDLPRLARSDWPR